MPDLNSNPNPTLSRWLKDNARNGVELNRLLAQLRSKGFAPFANPEVMQWALATAGLDRWSTRLTTKTRAKREQENFPYADLSSFCGAILPPLSYILPAFVFVLLLK